MTYSEKLNLIDTLSLLSHDLNVSKNYRQAAGDALKIVKQTIEVTPEELARFQYNAPEGSPNINFAEWYELAEATGVSGLWCRKICEYRDKMGISFMCPVDLLQVKGIGTGKIMKFIGKTQFGKPTKGGKYNDY